VPSGRERRPKANEGSARHLEGSGGTRANFKKAYETFPEKTFIARTPMIPGVNLTEEHVRGVLDFIRPYKNVVDYELLPYHRYGEAKYGFLGKVYELADFESSPPETMDHLRSIIDEAFGRNASQV
jgi:pyruvate formate lyase activating enzyme